MCRQCFTQKVCRKMLKSGGEDSFYVGTDSAVEERSHANYQEKLFLMAEGSQK